MRTMSSAGATALRSDAPLPPSTIEAHRAPRALPPGAALVAAVPVVFAAAVAAVGFTPVRVAGVLAVAAMAAGVVLHRRVGDRGVFDPVVLIGGGLMALVLTQGGLSDVKGAGWATAFALLAYPLLTRGFARLFSARAPGRDADLFVQAGLAALATGVALSVMTAGAAPHVRHAVLLPIVLASLDAGLLAIAARLLLLPGERVPAYTALAAGQAALLAAHLSLIAVIMRGGADVIVVELLAAVTFTLFGAAALHPSCRVLDDPVDGDLPAFSGRHLALVIAATLLGPLSVGAQVARHQPVSRTTALGAALVALMLAAYMASLLRDRATAEHRVHHDELTGLPNRTLLMDRIARAIAHARRSGAPVAVLFIDLDRFKWVNDHYGYGTGDALLRLTAERLGHALRDEDTVARMGGDEFGVLLPHVSGTDGVVTVAEKLLELFRAPVDIGGERFVATASVGVAIYPYDGDDPDSLIATADAAMYRAKTAGRDAFELHSAELASRAQERLAVEVALLSAIQHGELVLHYQPVFDLRTRAVVGAEALVRWQHPEQGLIMPGGFVPVAEQSDLVVTLGAAVLDNACEQLAKWADAGLPPVSVAVNVSARQLRQGMADLVAAALRTAGADPASLVLELTETAALDDLDHMAAALGEIRRMGVRWAIDDFGTGYCSLTYLSRLPVDTLKIDKSFVQSAAPADESIVAAIIAMAHGLGLTVVAEGVERPEQLSTLMARGCDLVQGFLLGPPLPAHQFEAFVRQQAALGAQASPASHASHAKYAVAPGPGRQGGQPRPNRSAIPRTSEMPSAAPAMPAPIPVPRPGAPARSMITTG
jgi:diguanylate cyclase (GGDEF)-like protein